MARQLACSSRAYLTGRTSRATLTTVGVVALEVNTLAGADVKPRLAGKLAGPAGADLACRASCSTLATVRVVGFQVNADAAAVGETGLTGQFTFSVGADLAGGTGVTARAAVFAVDEKIETGAVAVRGSRQTLAGAYHTFLTALTLHTALPTVAIVGLGIHADAGAVGWGDGRAAQRTLTLHTNLTGGAGVGAGATVGAVVLQIDALSRAVGLAGDTGDFARASRTYFTGVTDVAARAAVLVVGFDVHTGARAIGETRLA